MSEKHPEPPRPDGDPAAGDAGRKEPGKPYTTLDLEATEVSRRAADQGEHGAPVGAGAAASADAELGNATAEPGAASTGAPPPRQSSAHQPWYHHWVASLVAGAAGAVIAMLGLGQMGLLDGSGAVGERLAKVETSVANAHPAADLEKRLAAATERLGAVEASAKALATDNQKLAADAKAQVARMADTIPQAAKDRIAKLEQQLADLSAAAASDPQKGRIPALAGITAKLGDLDTEITTRTAQLKTELSQDVEKRLATAAATAEEQRARLAQRAQSIEQSLKSISDETSALRTVVDTVKADLDARFKAAAKPADVASAIDPVASKVDTLSKDVSRILHTEDTRNATAGTVLLSLELAGLKRAIDRGGNYAGELAAVRKASGGALDLSVLERAQNSGLPSLAELQKEFSTLAYGMLDADAAPVGGGVFERMLASAKSVVHVRKIEHDATDTSTEAVVGRMEIALRDGRYGVVLDEAKALPPKAAAAAGPWLDKIRARYQIDTALADLDRKLKDALAGAAAAAPATEAVVPPAQKGGK